MLWQHFKGKGQKAQCKDQTSFVQSSPICAGCSAVGSTQSSYYPLLPASTCSAPVGTPALLLSAVPATCSALWRVLQVLVDMLLVAPALHVAFPTKAALSCFGHNAECWPSRKEGPCERAAGGSRHAPGHGGAAY